MKLIDLRDSTGSGDVDISHVIKVTSPESLGEQKTIQGLSGRTLQVRTNVLFHDTRIERMFILQIPSDWKNPSGEYRLGIKALKQLLPSSAFERVLVTRSCSLDRSID